MGAGHPQPTCSSAGWPERSSALAAAAQLSGHPELARAAKAGAAGAISLSMVALVHDLGRPARFINMLRVFKVTSPMSVGTWILSAYTPLALGAAASAVTGKLPRAGLAATLPAAVLGPAVASYTSVLLRRHRGARLARRSPRDAVPVRRVRRRPPRAASACSPSAPARPGRPPGSAVLGAAAELTAKRLLMRRLGPAAEPYQTGAVRGDDAGQRGADRRRPGGRGAGRPEPGGLGAGRGGAAGRLGR